MGSGSGILFCLAIGILRIVFIFVDKIRQSTIYATVRSDLVPGLELRSARGPRASKGPFLRLDEPSRKIVHEILA